MNKKGNIFFGTAIAIFLFIIGILFIPFLTNDISTARASLDCTDSSISGGTMLTCLQVDILVPYVIWGLISIATGFIAGSKI